MTTFLILGGGQQGQVVAGELAKSLNNQVTLADFRPDLTHPNKHVRCEYFNATDVTKQYRNVLGTWFGSFQVVVSCLPSQFGGPCVALAAEYGVNYVDLSFTEDDPFELNPLAIHSQCTILTDCGLAPGLPNMVSGHYLDKYAGNGCGERLPELDIYVGGVAEDPTLPWGYVETWSLEDLYEEYVRPARYIENGQDKVVSPTDLKALRTVTFGGRKFEAFTSDGLRTLLKFKAAAPNMREWTLRHPGHMEKVQDLIYPAHDGNAIPKDAFVTSFRANLAQGNDEVILAIDCNGERFSLASTGDKDITAMAKTTAYTCATMAQFLADNTGLVDCPEARIDTGVMSMELIGMSPTYFEDILIRLAQKGLRLCSGPVE